MIIKDATGETVQLPKPAKRIVSLFPSQTHLLWYLGLDNEVVGVTRFCKYPPGWKNQKTVIGGTKDVKTERVASLQPDLILANKEENTKEIVEELKKIAPVYVSEIITWEDNLKFIEDIGQMTATTSRAKNLITLLNQKKEEFDKKYRNTPEKVLYFIWKKPWMTAGRKTFIDTMLQIAGYQNLTPLHKGRYPAWKPEELSEMRPDTVLLSSEPFPFKPEKHTEETQRIFPHSKILFVEGEPFTWTGAFPLQAFDYFEKLKKL